MRIIMKSLLFGAIVMAPSAFGQCSAPYLVEQRFPVSGPEQTRWRICWQVDPQNGLIITVAYFRTSPNSRWIQILWDARVSEIFVPYHDNSERYYDMSDVGGDLADVGPDDCPAGTRFQSDPQQPTNVCKEVRDRGLAWKEGPAVRRGQELVLWSSLIAGNYNYILEWTFRDDGIFIGRVGVTAANLPGNPWMTHMHEAIWRVDVDLDGPQNDSVTLGTHEEVGDFGHDTDTLVQSARGVEWHRFQFNYLDVSDSELKNSLLDQTTYMMMPLLFGTGRHTEDFTKNDFWVTAYDPTQMSARHLPDYVAPRQNVANTDVVIWYKGSLHHIPRDEDGRKVGQDGWEGETQVMWTGFIMMPHNLFDFTPLYP
jgi:Cu2+-containing amine oxidase